MAIELKDKRLYCVRTKENCYHSRIEASDAKEAIEIATKNMDDKCVYDVTCEKIYEASIGVENDYSEDTAESGDAVFEIVVRGTDKNRVDALKHALGLLIPGLHTENADKFSPNEIDDPRPLVSELKKLFVTGF